jgi:hypothetical protein
MIMVDEPEERIESCGVVEGVGIPYQTFNLGSAGSTPVGATNIPKGRVDYCPAVGGHVHSYINMIYWGHRHPYCVLCGFEDKTRLVE